jgi:hypothetical protein
MACPFGASLSHSDAPYSVGLDEWSARRRDLYLTTHNTQKIHTSMLLTWFEPAIPASDCPQTHALNDATTGIGKTEIKIRKYNDVIKRTLGTRIRISSEHLHVAVLHMLVCVRSELSKKSWCVCSGSCGDKKGIFLYNYGKINCNCVYAQVLDVYLTTTDTKASHYFPLSPVS